jgi:HlyD family secretion protein
MSAPSQFDVRRSIRRHLVAGVGVTGVLVFGVGGWAATTELSGAVVALGQLVVESDVKKVQHPTGGVVAELRVREGDRVQEGDLLVRLDQTKARANLAILKKSLDEYSARQARDEADLNGADHITFPDELLARATDARAGRLMAGENALFELQQSSRVGKKAQLTDRVSQLEQEINGLSGQIDAKKKEIKLIHEELAGVEELWSRNMVQITRVMTLRRDTARTEGELGQLTAKAAETWGKIDETKLQILQIDQDWGTEVGKELADVRSKIAETSERVIPAEDELKRVDIRAPQTGFVHQLTVHTIGGVIPGQGEPIMLIVPDADSLRVDVKIQPNDIDQLYVGQRAILRFTTFNQRTTPELVGKVSLVAADVSQDTKTGANYYLVHVSVAADEIARLGSVRLVPGMPVEAFIETNSRTAISYLVRPLRDQMAKAFKEK